MKSYMEKAEKALADMGGFWTVADVLAAIEVGDMQSFTSHDEEAWLVTHVCDFPQKRVLDVVLLVGEEKHLEELEETATQYAIEVGAEAILGTGRKGWMPRAKGEWRVLSINYYKEV